MLEKQACKAYFRKFFTVLLACLIFSALFIVLDFTFTEPLSVSAEENEEPIVLPDEDEDPDQGDNQNPELPDLSDPDSAGSPEASSQSIITVVKIDWSGIAAEEIPETVEIIILPDNNNLYATSLTMSAASNWENSFEMPLGTSQVNFNIPATGFQFGVESSGNTYTLIPSKESPADDPYVHVVNTNPGAELSNVAIPSADNSVPPNAELKIRLDKGDASKESINFAKEERQEPSPEDEALRKKLAENAEGTADTKLYIIAAIIAGVLALSLILLRIILGIKSRKAAREAEEDYYPPQPRRRR